VIDFCEELLARVVASEGQGDVLERRPARRLQLADDLIRALDGGAELAEQVRDA